MPTSVCFRRESWSWTHQAPFMRETSRQDAFTYPEMMTAAIMLPRPSSCFRFRSSSSRLHRQPLQSAMVEKRKL